MHPDDANNLLSDYTQKSYYYKDQTEAIILVTDLYTYQTVKGGDHEQTLCPDITPTRII
jgi:hypothetical protein